MFSRNDGLLHNRAGSPDLIAVLEGGRLADLWTEENSPYRPDSVHLTRVTGRFDQHKRVSGQLQGGRAVSWPAKAGTKLSTGQLALVTVTATMREDKPLQAVAGSELAGRYLTLRWQEQNAGQGQVQISRKIRPSAQLDQQRDRIAAACHDAGLLDAGFTFIIRRSAFTPDGVVSETHLHAVLAEAEQMITDWQANADMPADFKSASEARLVYSGPTLAGRLNLLYAHRPVGLITDQDWPVLCEQIDAACQPKYLTRHGAILWIEQTRAAVMIDIDSAASKLAPGPLSEAVLPDLFAQIRLRRLAGKILVDMPALNRDQRNKRLQQADQLARKDPRYPTCLGFTRSGILELSVRHGRPVLDKDDRVQAAMNETLR